MKSTRCRTRCNMGPAATSLYISLAGPINQSNVAADESSRGDITLKGKVSGALRFCML